MFIKNMSYANELYQEGFSIRTVSKFNSYLAKPLFLDYTIDLTFTEEKDSHLYIESPGITLRELCNKEEVSITKTYKLMKHSARALLLLYNMGIMNFNITPDNMLYEEVGDTIKFINRKLKAINMESGLHISSSAVFKDEKEILKYIPNEMLETADVYYWAKSFCALIAQRKDSKEVKEDYLKLVDESLNPISPLEYNKRIQYMN